MKLIRSIVACAALSTEAESACLSTDHPDDCAGLAAIAASMHSDKWVKNTHCKRHTVSLLNTTTLICASGRLPGLDGKHSVCAWHGLACNSAGRVNSIDLTGNNLRGSIPDAIR
jgi:hypothetical protein